MPFLTVGATDARFFRRLGTVAYGFGLFSERLTFEQYAAMFHGIDERVDVASLGLSAELWDGLARQSLAVSTPAAPAPPIDAVLFDFGGVITDSPFDAFARYERDHGLPDGLHPAP